MATVKMTQAIVDQMAKLEVDALLEGLQDPELCKNPAFLAKVRQFLKDNDIVTTTETEGVERLVQDVNSIPDLVGDEVVH